MAVVRDKPTGRLGQEPNRRELDQTRAELEKRRESPGPGAIDISGAKGDPGGRDAPEEPTVMK